MWTERVILKDAQQGCEHQNRCVVCMRGYCIHWYHGEFFLLALKYKTLMAKKKVWLKHFWAGC
jgi:hypothetical protein